MSTTPLWAQQVCRLCKTRKKACDKLLPRCTYCARRGVTCVYEQPSNKSAVILPAHDDELAAGALQAAQAVLAMPAGPFGMVMPSSTTTTDISDHDAALALTIKAHVLDSLRAAGLSPENVWEAFYRDFWPYLSIVSPKFLENEINEPVVPRVEAPLLLLAMCLVTRKATQPIKFYAALKTLVSAVQTFKHCSVMLVQVHLLIAAFEYSKDWLETASVTISLCVRMAELLDMDRAGKIIESDIANAGLRIRESWNIWCGIALFETVLMSDREGDKLYNDLLAADMLNPCELDEGTSRQRCGSVSGVADDTHVKPFARQLQAAWLLQRTVNAIRSRASWDEVSEIDDDLRRLLNLALRDDGRSSPPGGGHMGIAIAILVRARYMLNEWMLDEGHMVEGDVTISERDDQKYKAFLAVESASRMMFDTLASGTHDHRHPSSVHLLPLCCRSNVKTARRQVQFKRGGQEYMLAELSQLENDMGWLS